MGDIDHGQLQADSDLRCGETYPAGVDHGFDHVGDEFADTVVDGFDRSALLAEDGIAVLDDGKKHRKGGKIILQERKGGSATRSRGNSGKVPVFDTPTCAAGKLD